jgi:hypothetical protein
MRRLTTFNSKSFISYAFSANCIPCCPIHQTRTRAKMFHRHTTSSTTNIRYQEELVTPPVVPLCLGPSPPAFPSRQQDQAEPRDQDRQWLIPLPLLGRRASLFLPPLSAMDPSPDNTSPVSIACTGDDVARDLSKAPMRPLPTRVCLPMRVSSQRTPSQGSSAPTVLVTEKRTTAMPELPLLRKLCELEHGTTQGHLSLPRTRLQPRFLI